MFARTRRIDKLYVQCIACLVTVYLGTLTLRGLPSGSGKYTSEQPAVKDVEGSGRGRV
jgi:hypothetical protein